MTLELSADDVASKLAEQVRKCRSCHNPVVWGRNPRTQKTNLLDPEPVENGNVRIVDFAEDGTPLLAYGPPGSGTHVSHFATCPNADQHRRS